MAARTFRLRGQAVGETPVVARNLDAASAQLPPGAYSTFRTYRRNQVFMLTQHLDRLTQSAEREGYSAAVMRDALQRALHAVVEVCGWSETRLRITLCYDQERTVFISAEQFLPLPPHLYEEGVLCALAEAGLRRTVPEAKSTRFIAEAVAARSQHPEVHELLLTDGDGHILEGTSSNFFAVKSGTLYTAYEGVLQGTTAAQVLAVADGVLPIARVSVAVRELSTVGEAFLTSVSRGVLPIAGIADVMNWRAGPGPVTRLLSERLNHSIERQLEPLDAA